MEQEPENQLYPTLTEDGKKESELLMQRFEKELNDHAVRIIRNITTDFYSGISYNVESDHWQNFRQKIVNGICDYRNSEKFPYDFKRIRKAIYEEHKEAINNDLNQDHLKEIERLNAIIRDLKDF